LEYLLGREEVNFHDFKQVLWYEIIIINKGKGGDGATTNNDLRAASKGGMNHSFYRYNLLILHL